MQDCVAKGRNATKLTEQDVIAIRQKSANGALGKHLALEYKISASNISAIIKRQAWRHVE
jgi:hypothetical protein